LSRSNLVSARLGTPISRAPREGGPIGDIRQGGTVWFSQGEVHWHGATAITAMSHIAIHEKLEGSAADRMEPVPDAQYRG